MDSLATSGKQSLMPAPTQLPGEGELRAEIVGLIRKSETGIPFSLFMEKALYHPQHGYYSRNPRIGRGGDFYTSVSVGPCFGLLLARQILQIREQLGNPEGFTLIEQGAHDGQLAKDILAEAGDLPVAIAEPREKLREAQKARLGDKLRVAPSLEALGQAKSAVYLCNELLDALPMERMQFVDGAWRQLRVQLDEQEQFTEQALPIAEADQSVLLPLLPKEAPEGFITEICLAMQPLIQEIYGSFERGVAIVIDYGMPGSDFFERERADGTLRTYRQHQAIDAPFEAVGHSDITAQVNFSHAKRFAEEAGFEVLGFTDQNRFLTGVATSWLLEQEGREPTADEAALRRQFMALTHPGNMGRNFKVLVLGKNCSDLKLDGLQWPAAL